MKSKKKMKKVKDKVKKTKSTKKSKKKSKGRILMEGIDDLRTSMENALKNKSMGEEVKEALEWVLVQEKTINKYAGDSIDNFLKEENKVQSNADTLDEIERYWKERTIETQESTEPKKSWCEYFFSIFGLKRK